MEAAALATTEKAIEELYAKLKPFVEAHAQQLFSNLLAESESLIEAKLKAKHGLFSGLELRGAQAALAIISEALGEQALAPAATTTSK